METIIPWILSHADSAPWIVFGLVLLAGFNLPISIDILLVLITVLSATILPEKTLLLYTAFTVGCIISAWEAYWLGRILGRKLLQLQFFKKIVTEEKLTRVAHFYDRFGFLTFLCGRFIPFGVRNCLFMSSGISKLSFARFVLFDAIACTFWSTLFFTLFLSIGHNFDALLTKLKWINICIFISFSVTVIAIICYKMKKRNESH